MGRSADDVRARRHAQRRFAARPRGLLKRVTPEIIGLLGGRVRASGEGAARFR